MNYKDTLLMPKTDFEMRGNLPKKEPKYVERWQENDMYNKVIQQNEGKDSFVFHDGPPYANVNMHMGHMLNKVIKDVICRYKNMNGFYTPYIPGWDTHGLPIENAIQKLGVNRKEMPTAKFREKCDAYAHEQVNKQMEQLIRMGTFADYKHPYLTLQHEFEARQIEVFAKMAMDGIRLNPQLQEHIRECYEHIKPVGINAPILVSQKGTVFSVQRINIILKEVKKKYKLKIKNFSCHSLRKTFGRQVYNMNCDNSELALVKLMELFNHSSVAITKRYLGLRQEEILQTYESLSF